MDQSSENPRLKKTNKKNKKKKTVWQNKRRPRKRIHYPVLVDCANDAVVVQNNDVGMARVKGDVSDGGRSIDPLTGQFRRQLPREGRELFTFDVVLDDLHRRHGKMTFIT